MVENVVTGIFLTTICVLGIMGNSITLLILNSNQQMRNQPINIYLTVLSIYDNGVLFNAILMLCVPSIHKLMYGERREIQTEETTPIPIPDFDFPFPTSPKQELNPTSFGPSNHPFYHSTSVQSSTSSSRSTTAYGEATAGVLLTTPSILVDSEDLLNATSNESLSNTSSAASIVTTSFPETRGTSFHPSQHSTFRLTASTPPRLVKNHRSIPGRQGVDGRKKKKQGKKEEEGDEEEGSLIQRKSNPTHAIQVLASTSVRTASLTLPSPLFHVLISTEDSASSSLLPDPASTQQTSSSHVEERSSEMLSGDKRQNSVNTIREHDANSVSEAITTQASNAHATQSQTTSSSPLPSSPPSDNDLLVDVIRSYVESEGGIHEHVNNTQLYENLDQEEVSFRREEGRDFLTSLGEKLAGLGSNKSSASDHIDDSVGPLHLYIEFVYPLALISQTGSVWTTCLITCERYFAIVHPLQALTLSTRKRAFYTLSTLSVLAVIYNLPRFYEVEIAAPHEGSTVKNVIRQSELRQNSTYYLIYHIIVYLALLYIIPLSLLSVLNTKIYLAIRKANRDRSSLTQTQESEMNIATMLVFLVTIFIACNLPAFVVNCLELVEAEIFTHLMHVSNFLICFNSSINFVIYCTFGKKFRRRLRDLLICPCSNDHLPRRTTPIRNRRSSVVAETLV